MTEPPVPNAPIGIIIIGGGLAGSEAAWQAAQSGFKVQLYEMPTSMPQSSFSSSTC